MKKIVRIQKIEIENFKSVKHGKIELGKKDNIFEILEDSKMLGIYGQNGSGKTSVIEAANILKRLLKGERLSEKVLEYITKDSNYFKINVNFYIEESEKEKFLLTYSCEVEKKEITLKTYEELEKNRIILTEKLKIREFYDGKWKRIRNILENKKVPELLKQRILINEKMLLNYRVGRLLTEREGRSFIFSEELEKILKENEKKIEGDFRFIRILKDYGIRNLYVISNKESSLINGNLMIPFSFRCKTGNTVSQGKLLISLSEPTFLLEKEYQIINNIIKQLNIVLNSLIPNLELEIAVIKEDINKEMELGKSIRLISKRDDIRIPLEYESDGIKKIISILSTLIVAYNEPSFSLFIDELDAGIFEYLLGEILKIIEKYGKGQLVFTSHNLRPLEVLESKHIHFSTVNPYEKYIKISNVKKTNNLRSIYMREMAIGESKIPLYKGNNINKMRLAFKEAWCENE